MDNDANENQEAKSELKELPQLLTANEPDVKLETLFPRPGRYFSWNRFRKEAKKGGWEVPQLKQNAVIDKLVWLAFDLFMYSCITLFLFGILYFVGVHQPLGSFTKYLVFFCLGYVLLYVVLLFVATGIEMIFGLHSFPDGVETVGQLQELILKNNAQNPEQESEQQESDQQESEE